MGIRAIRASGSSAAGCDVTVLGRYLAAAGRSTTMDQKPIFDEFAAADGTVRQGWSSLLAVLDEFADTDLLQAQYEVARLLGGRQRHVHT